MIDEEEDTVERLAVLEEQETVDEWDGPATLDDVASSWQVEDFVDRQVISDMASASLENKDLNNYTTYAVQNIHF